MPEHVYEHWLVCQVQVGHRMIKPYRLQVGDLQLIGAGTQRRYDQLVKFTCGWLQDPLPL